MHHITWACFRNGYSVRIMASLLQHHGIITEALKLSLHYENTPMPNTTFFHGCKNNIIQMKNGDVFLIFAQNIDCGYTLEPPH